MLQQPDNASTAANSSVVVDVGLVEEQFATLASY